MVKTLCYPREMSILFLFDEAPPISLVSPGTTLLSKYVDIARGTAKK